MLERTPIKVVSVGLVSAAPQPLGAIREFVIERPCDYSKYNICSLFSLYSVPANSIWIMFSECSSHGEPSSHDVAFDVG